MKAKLAGNDVSIFGFSTLEIMIALALMALIITTSLQTVFMSQYWLLGGSVSAEALSLGKMQLEVAQLTARTNFYAASTSLVVTVKSQTSSNTIQCSSSFCYQSKLIVSDISVCAKTLSSDVSWRISPRYSTTSVTLDTVVVNPREVVARGGDCLVASPGGNWLAPILTTNSITTDAPQSTSGIDILGSYIYQTASVEPQLQIYQESIEEGSTPVLVGTSSGAGLRLNAIDAVRDMGTGRKYVYVAQHASTSQLGVFDVTNPALPVLLTQRTLLDVDSSASFPQGWRLVAYGNRLYVFTRETAGAELHIFDITRPEQPIELSSGLFNLNRTVNDVVIREQIVNGVLRRFLVLAGSANLKELGVFEVTGDVPVERVMIDLPGSEDALSIYLGGNTVYLGRRITSSGPELYQFDFLELLHGGTLPIAMSEVSADVSTIRMSGPVLYLGTNRSGFEFQVWDTRADVWSTTSANSARISAQSVSRLAPLGIELSSRFLYAHSQSAAQPEQLVVITTP